MEIQLIYNVVLVSAVQQCEWIIYIYIYMCVCVCVCVCVWKWKSLSHVWLFGTPWTDNRGWDGWMASPTQGTWVWARSGSWWLTGKPGVLQSMGLQRVRRDWVTELDYTVHGILQARILEWVAFSFSRGSSQPRDRTQVSHTAGGFFTSWATREAQEYWSG